MEELLRNAIEQQKQTLSDSREKVNEVSGLYAESIRKPWKTTVENIKEAVETINSINDEGDEDETS